MIYYAYIFILWAISNMAVAIFQEDLGDRSFLILKILDVMAIMAAVTVFSFGG